GAGGPPGAGAVPRAPARASPFLSRAPDRRLLAKPSMRLEDLDYALPPERIARHPLARREDSRLLVVDRVTGTLTDSRFADLGSWLDPGDTLAVNETRVRPARLQTRRPTGGQVELLIVRPGPDGACLALAPPAKRARP